MKKLKKYGITFQVDEIFVEDFFALKEGWEQMSSVLDCLQTQLDSDLRALLNAGWISLADVKYVEEQFIYSDVGFRQAREICPNVRS